MRKRITKIFLWSILILVIACAGLFCYLYVVAKTDPPATADADTSEINVTQPDPGLFLVGNNWFRKSESGLYELYVEGKPLERGLAMGALTKDLAQYQEKVFVDQIQQIVPSQAYLQVLKYFVGWFNRNLDDHVQDEYKLEIYGISQFASHEYDNIADPYQRILNYHAAHDIGHALQNMSLVGCSSFATWGPSSEQGSLIVGRNFDFYVGDDFSKNKIVAFVNPEKGHQFMMVTFGGMAGVLSGMNVEGLTVTINAAKSEIPSGAATPVSLVAREILQYASTIDEAYVIASKRKMFVAESFLIGSAKDGRAAVIEKNDETTALYEPDGSTLICTNHFQSDLLSTIEANKEHMNTSASPYRHQRIRQLLGRHGVNTVAKSVRLLRDTAGLNDADIGLGNEKSINQLVAHHGIVFQPEKKLVWVSTAPWQLGKFVCYDLNKVFNLQLRSNQEIYERNLEIAADSFLLSSRFKDCEKFNRYRFPFSSKDSLNPDSIVAWNSNSYYSYMLAGDYYMKHDSFEKAIVSYEKALTLEIATTNERDYLLEKLQLCKQKLE